MISKVYRWFFSDHATAKARGIGILIGVLVALFVLMTKGHAFVMMDIIEFGHPVDIELVEPDRMMYDLYDNNRYPENHDGSDSRENNSRERESVLTDSCMGYS